MPAESLSQEQVRAILRGDHVPQKRSVSAGTVKPNTLTHSVKAQGRKIHLPGAMNKTEARYAQRLDAIHRSGVLAWWAFEPIKLRLAEKTFYCPDFAVMYAANGAIEFHEVKGFWEDDARVKIKVAARLFPMFTFIAFKPIKGGEWEQETFV